MKCLEFVAAACGRMTNLLAMESMQIGVIAAPNAG